MGNADSFVAASVAWSKGIYVALVNYSYVRALYDHSVSVWCWDMVGLSAMALEWCSRMLNFYDVYLALADPDFTYS